MTMRPLLLCMLLLGIGGGVHAWWSSAGATPAPAALAAGDPRRLTGEDGIVMLAADWCGYCRRQQADFERAQVRYRVLDVEQEEGRLAAAALGREGVPITVIGQHVIDGYDTAALDAHLLPLGYRVY
ncbi:glutaredoxin family protein [Xanthomonas graminis]|uniref:glutaredoxin family protein n=1 Tax=Xanthomonas graminis TaxID=3390026 RepID=UPI001F1C1DB4|nr:glutaredoxin family protein [Xanthomonas translucens]UKE72492.1 glutaredoxin family protein [Xanthomonas translucens pv. phleipratensis]